MSLEEHPYQSCQMNLLIDALAAMVGGFGMLHIIRVSFQSLFILSSIANT